MARSRRPERFFRYHVPLPRILGRSNLLPYVLCAYCGMSELQGAMKTDEFGQQYCFRHKYPNRNPDRR
jgi:hypothetical protein